MTQESEKMLSDDRMMMPMDAGVAKPENNYPGMMNLVRVFQVNLPNTINIIKAKQVDPSLLQGGMSGLDHSKMGHWSEGQSARLD